MSATGRVDTSTVDGFRIEARGIASPQNDLTLEWTTHGRATSDIILKWHTKHVVYDDIILQWEILQSVYDDIILQWEILQSVYDDLIIKWAERSTIYDDLIIKWAERSPIYDDIILQWEVLRSVYDDVILKWVEGPTLGGLVDYLEIITSDGGALHPEIINIRAELKTFGTLDRIILHVKEPIPEDSKCRLYLRGDVIYLEGISRACIQKYDIDESYYEVEVREYAEILKPIEPKGGLYLVKNSWENVTVSQLLSSDKPSDNDNIVGMIYMAAAAIDFEFWALHDSTYRIYKFEYEGAAFTISEVFEDGTLLTERISVAALESASGWYHDTVNKILYVRTSDSTSPYYHVISVPNIWDGIMPVRLGVISSGGSTNIAYWETANGDIPLENINTLLMALGLEASASVRNGICYIDVSDRAGAGTEGEPAQYYHADTNIKSVNEIIVNDARYTVAGVILTGYGSGSGAVHAGAFRNMGRGGRKVRLDDSSIHSTVQAQNYVDNYIDDAFLPAHGISFEAPLRVGDTIDQRRVGDTIKIEVPEAKFNQVLRIQTLKPDILKNSLTIMAGDRLYTLEDQLAAIKKANDKYRKHLEDEIETFSWNWEINLTSGLDRSTTFDITSDALYMQKLELSASVSKMVLDGALTNPTVGHDHTSATNQAGVSAHGNVGSHLGYDHDATGDDGEHWHSVAGQAAEQTEGYDARVVGNDLSLGGVTADHSHAGPSHTHVENVHAAYTGYSDPDWHRHIFNSSLDESTSASGTGETSGVSADHTHGKSYTPYDVAIWYHVHTVSGTTTDTEYDHSHGGSTGHTSATRAGSSDHTATQTHGITDSDSGQQILEANPAESIECDSGGSDTEMYLSIYINEVEIDGSPFSVEVADDIGAVAIDALVPTAGTYAIRASVANKTYPLEECRCKINLKLLGRIYVSTIVT